MSAAALKVDVKRAQREGAGERKGRRRVIKEPKTGAQSQTEHLRPPHPESLMGPLANR